MNELDFLTNPNTPIEVFDAYVHQAQALAINANKRLDSIINLRQDFISSNQAGERLQYLLSLRSRFHGLANILILARLEKFITEIEDSFNVIPFP